MGTNEASRYVLLNRFLTNKQIYRLYKESVVRLRKECNEMEKDLLELREAGLIK